jgi:DNA primase
MYTNVGTSVFDVLRDEVPLNRILEVDGQGKALCVEHDEDSPSMHVYDDHVHCFGCSFHGDVTNVWQAKRGIRSPLEAARELAREYEIQLPEMSSEAWERLGRQRGEQELHLATAREAHSRLSEKRKVREWWSSRGFDEELSERFILGASEDGKAAVIPMFYRGRVLGLIYRNLSGKTKYVLPPADELPGGYKPLFIAAPLRNQIFLVEGYIDALAVAATGKSAIAVGGTSLSDEQLQDLKRVIPRDARLYVLCDDDDAGAAAARQWSRTLYPLSMTCARDFGQDAEDIADTFSREGSDTTSEHLDRLIDNAADPVDVETEALGALDKLTPRQKLRHALEHIVPLLAKLEPESMRSANADMVVAAVPSLKKKWLTDGMKEERLRADDEFWQQAAAEARQRMAEEREAYLAEVEKIQPEIDERLSPGVLPRLRDVAAVLNKVVGDEKPLELALLVALGAQLDPLPNGKPMGASILLTAVAGRGKNYIADAACKPLPEEFYYAFEIASGQSFYYRVETDPTFLQHTFLYPNEIEGAETLWEFLRPMLSKGSAEKQVTAKDAMGNMTIKIINVQGPITLAIPTIRNKTDEQMQTRLLVAELPDYTGRVKRHSAAHSRLLRSSAYEEIDHDHEVWVWQEALRQITGVRKVVFDLPHPDFALDDDQLSHGARTWANLLSLMATHAWLEQKNRRILDVGKDRRVVEATPDDYEVAYDIFSEVCKRTIVNLSDTHRKILNGTHDLHTEYPNREGFVYREIGEKAGVSISTISDNKTFLVTAAKLMREGEHGLSLVAGAEPSWWEEGDLTKGLPSPDKVRTWWNDRGPRDPGGGSEATPHHAEAKPAEQPNTGVPEDPKAA